MSNSIQKQQSQPNTLTLLNSMSGEIKKALPKHLDPERVTRIVVTECRKNPKLLECDQFSFIGAVIQSAQLGLEVGSGLGHAYLIPYGKECQLITGYKGLIDLARRSGQVAGLSALCVYEGEPFEHQVVNGIESISHKPTLGKKSDEKIIAAYAVGHLTTGGIPQVAVMGIDEIKEIRDTKSKGASRPDSPWKKHFAEMCKKTVVRRLCKMLPQSPEIQIALNVEENGKSHQPFIDAGVIDVDYSPLGGHDKEKITGMQSGESGQRQSNVSKKEALEIYSSAASAFAKSGGNIQDALEALKLTPDSVCDLEPERILTVAEILEKKASVKK